jgi:hypothetical protein
VAASCEHGNEPSGFIKGGKFLGHLSEYFLLKKDIDQWNLWMVSFQFFIVALSIFASLFSSSVSQETVFTQQCVTSSVSAPRVAPPSGVGNETK